MKTYVNLDGNRVITSVIECSDDMESPVGAELYDTELPIQDLLGGTLSVNMEFTPKNVIVNAQPEPQNAFE